MPRPRLTVTVLPAGERPDSRADQRAYWLARPPAQRVRAGREFHRKICAWFHLRGPSLREAIRKVRPIE